MSTSSIESIEYRAFSRCKLLNIISFPATLKRISYEAFYECTNLGTVEFANSHGWFFVDKDSEIPTEIKEGENCTHISNIQAYMFNDFRWSNWFKIDKIPAPTIEIVNGVITITDYSGLAEKFKISVSSASGKKEWETYATTTIKAGTWSAINEFSLPESGAVSANIPFLSTDDTGKSITGSSMIMIENAEGKAEMLSYGVSATVEALVYTNNRWMNEGCKTLVVTKDTVVNEEFFLWFMANFTKA